MQNSLKLQAVQANTTQEDPNWTLVDGNSREILARFSQRLSDDDIIALIEFGKKYEMLAFQLGLTTGREEVTKQNEAQIKRLMGHITSLEHHNAMLAEKLNDYLENGVTNGNH